MKHKELIRDPKVDKIIKSVFDYFNFDLFLLEDSLKTNEVVMAKYICFKLLKEQFHLSSTKIGRIFNRDHSTVLYGIKTLSWDMKYNKELLNIYQKFLLELF